MDESTYGFNQQDARDLIELIEDREVIIPEYRTFVAGGSIKYAYPPSGGLPAASYNATTEKLTPSSSNCELAELSAGVYQRSGSSVAVENPVGVIVGASGKPITIGKTAYGKWTVLVEDCSGTDEGGGGDPNPEPPVPDAISSGTSKGVDMGYALGV